MPTSIRPWLKMIEHADFLGEPQRMMRRQHIDQRAEADALRPLRDRGEEHARATASD